MKIILSDSKKEIIYDHNYVYINNVRKAKYTKEAVIWLDTQKVIAIFDSFYLNADAQMQFGRKRKIHTTYYTNTLLNPDTRKILATFDENPHGAIAAYVTHCYTVFKENIKSIQEQTNTKPKEEVAITKPQEYIKEKPRENKEKKESIEPLKKEYQEPVKTPDYSRPEPPRYTPSVPNGVPVQNSGSCLGIIIIGVIIYFAIALIPQSWRDLGEYIPEGDLGIIISFLSPVIGAIIGLITCIYSKKSYFSNALGAFLTTCGIGIGICAIVLLSDICKGNAEFTGFILFDIPLCFFAPLLGCFQFALPIGIVAIIVYGIIHAVKSSTKP